MRAILVIAAIYVGVSCVAHRFRHPELTAIQALLNVGDALLWR